MGVVCGALPLPSTTLEEKRIAKVAQWFTWEMGKLYLEGKCRRRVPPIGERKRIVLGVAQQLGYPSGHRLMQVLASRYYWKGMAIDCQLWCSQVLPMQMD